MHPGSHESVIEYENASHGLLSTHANLVDAAKERTITIHGYKIVFLPGSDILAGGEYQLMSDDILKTGLYTRDKEYIGIFNIRDLEEQITDGERTLLITHVPKRFHTKYGIDVAEYFETKEGIVPAFAMIPHLRSRGMPEHEIARYLKKENIGNEELESTVKKLGITKMVSGHIHEAGQKGNDFHGNIIREGVEGRELFFNPGPAPAGKVGIYVIDTNTNLAQYRLIQI